jgi:predicted enzyme related to lactoylglutathione lyase
MRWTAVILFFGLILSAGWPAPGGVAPLESSKAGVPGISGNLVFFYYRDLAGAKTFYGETLDLPLVLDYGYAAIYRITETSFVGLVDEAKGMHKATEPKTVTLAFVTDEVDGWYSYLTRRGVKMHKPLKDSPSIDVRGFVALDPEGYFLEFEDFFATPRNAGIRGKLDALRSHYSTTWGRPKGLGLRATVFWLYYNDLAPAQKFVEDVFGVSLLVDQGFSKVYPCTASGFLGLVDQSQGLHKFTETKAVNVAFQTPHLEAWYERFKSRGIPIRSPLEDADGSLVRAFVALDPAGYFLEFHWFRPDPKNEAILKILAK